MTNTSSLAFFPPLKLRTTWPILALGLCLLFGTLEWSSPSYAGTIPSGRVRIFKVTEPAGSQTEFAFTFTGNGQSRIFSLQDGERKRLNNIRATDGYQLQETVPSGWMQQEASCNNGSPINNISVGEDEIVTCTFTNVQLGKLIIKTVTDPTDDVATSFPFMTGSGLSPNTFSLKNGEHQVFKNLIPSNISGKTYGVSEMVPSGWLLSDVTCSDGSPINQIDVGPGEIVTCIFANLQRGKLIVRKVTDPNPDRTNTTFPFTTDNTLALNNFTLRNGETRTFLDLVPRAGYQVRELGATNWQVESSSCDNDTPTTNIRIDPGVTVICTFRNRGTAVELALTKDDGDITAEPGDTIVYTLHYRNDGTQTATAVLLTEEVPANTFFVGPVQTNGMPGWDCSVNAAAGTRCQYAIGNLGAGGTEGQVEFKVRVNGSLPATVTTITNTAKISYADAVDVAESTTTTDVEVTTVGLSLSKDDGGVAAEAGEIVVYQLQYANTGNRTETDVRLIELVPDHTTFAGPADQWDCPVGSAARTICTHSIGTLAGGATGVQEFRVKVIDSLPPTIATFRNFANIGSNDIPNAAEGTEVTEIKAVPDLALEMNDKGVTVVPGDVIQYQLTYSNLGTQAATNVLVTENIPTHAQFNADQSSDGWNCAAKICTYPVGIVASGASANLTFALTVDRPLPLGVDAIDNVATIQDDGNNGSDPDLDNNEARESTPIVDNADVTATKQDRLVIDANNDGIASPGDVLEYLVTLTNQRGLPVRNVIFNDQLDPILVLDANIQTDQGTVSLQNDESGSRIRVDLGTLPSDQPVTIRFRTQIQTPLPNGINGISNQGIVESSDFETKGTDDPDTTAASDPTETAINASVVLESTLADLLFVDANDDELVSVGDTLIYELVIRNLGNGGSDPVQLHIPLAENVVPVASSVTTTAGAINEGNDPEDRNVRISVDEIAGGAEVNVSFQVRIVPTVGFSTIQHQAIAQSGNQEDIASDDPDTAAGTDPTVTNLNQAVITIQRLYLPVINRNTK